MHPQTFFFTFSIAVTFYVVSLDTIHNFKKENKKARNHSLFCYLDRRPSKNIFFVMTMRCDHCVEYYPHIILLMLKLNLWLIKLTTKLPCIVFPCKSELLSYCNGEQPKTQNQAKKVSIMSHIFVVLSFWGRYFLVLKARTFKPRMCNNLTNTKLTLR